MQMSGATISQPPPPMQFTQHGNMQGPPPPMAPPMPMYPIIHKHPFGLFVGLLRMFLLPSLLLSKLPILRRINLVVEEQLLHYMRMVRGCFG